MFKIAALDAPLGAQITNFDFARDGHLVDEINKAWHEHVILVFRDQPTEPETLASIARMFGTPVRQPLQRPEYQVEGFPELRLLSSQHIDTLGDKKPLRIGGSWHTDHSHFPVPPRATILQAIKIPEEGGDTCFSNQRAAYEALDADTRATIDQLEAKHVYNSRFTPRRMPTISGDEGKKQPEALHPVARPHPETGKRAIYLNPVRVDAIPGMEDDAAMGLVNDLIDHSTRDEFVYRHKWRVGDVLIWDNRQAMHMVHHDYAPDVERLMRRTMIEGP